MRLINTEENRLVMSVWCAGNDTPCQLALDKESKSLAFDGHWLLESSAEPDTESVAAFQNYIIEVVRPRLMKKKAC